MKALSLVTETSSSSNLSGGLSSTSIGLPRPKDGKLKSSSSSWLRTFSEICDLGTMESTVIRLPFVDRWPERPRRTGGGMLVTANSVATDEGIESGEPASRALLW